MSLQGLLVTVWLLSTKSCTHKALSKTNWRNCSHLAGHNVPYYILSIALALLHCCWSADVGGGSGNRLLLSQLLQWVVLVWVAVGNWHFPVIFAYVTVTFVLPSPITCLPAIVRPPFRLLVLRSEWPFATASAAAAAIVATVAHSPATCWTAGWESADVILFANEI